jgi:hypothetical protein
MERILVLRRLRDELSEYHRWPCRKHPSIQIGLANAEILPGAVASQRGSLQPSLLILQSARGKRQSTISQRMK